MTNQSSLSMGSTAHFIKTDVIDPYKALKPVLSDISIAEGSPYDVSEPTSEGGSVMVAYGRMQFTKMKEDERKNVAQNLLRYCGLDTLAM